VRRTFLDGARDAALHRLGFVKLRLLDDDQMDELRRRFAMLRPADRFDPPGGTPTNPTTYHCTFLDTDLAYKEAFDELVRSTLDPVLAGLFDRYVLLTANCYAKQPGRGAFEVHQNWTLTTDPGDVTVTVWLPLHDTDAENGTLAVVPGSHKLTGDIAFPRGGHYFSAYDDVIARDHFVPLPVRAGEAVVFDDNLIHGSGLNRGASPRFALQVAAIPAEAEPVVWYPRPDGTFDLLAAPGRFYVETTLADIDDWPSRFPVVRSEPNPNRPLPQEQFTDRLARAEEVRRELWGWSS
jgi:hypothetical protein